jgi:hypothetical protein
MSGVPHKSQGIELAIRGRWWPRRYRSPSQTRGSETLLRLHPASGLPDCLTSGNAAAGIPCSTARAISSPVKYGRSTLSGPGTGSKPHS